MARTPALGTVPPVTGVGFCTSSNTTTAQRNTIFSDPLFDTYTAGVSNSCTWQAFQYNYCVKSGPGGVGCACAVLSQPNWVQYYKADQKNWFPCNTVGANAFIGENGQETVLY